MIGYLSSASFQCSDQITVRCLSCWGGQTGAGYLEARPGGNLTLRYEVDNVDFRILTIKYNGTNNRLEVRQLTYRPLVSVNINRASV